MRCCNGATPPKPQTLVPQGGGLILAATPLQYEREMQREKISQIILKSGQKNYGKNSTFLLLIALLQSLFGDFILFI